MSFLGRFGVNLSTARLRSGLTQKQLAQKIGVSTNCVSMYETGKRMPNIKTVRIIADALHVSTGELIPIIDHDDLPCCASTTLPGQTSIYDLLGEKDV